MNVSLCPVGQVDQVWPALRGGFHDAIMATGGDLTTGELWTQCRNGSAHLIIAHDGEAIHGASVWRSEVWQTGSKFRCLALYGTGMKDWIGDMHELVKRIAADCGATSIISEGRCGKGGEPLWTRQFPNAKPLRILYEEQLS